MCGNKCRCVCVEQEAGINAQIKQLESFRRDLVKRKEECISQMREVIVPGDAQEKKGMSGSSADAPKAKTQGPTSSHAASGIPQSQPSSSDVNLADQGQAATFGGTATNIPQEPWPHCQKVIDAAKKAEGVAIESLETLLMQEFDPEWKHLELHVVVVHIKAARQFLVEENKMKAAADALLAMRPGGPACPLGKESQLYKKFSKAENNVRDVAMWRCQLMVPLDKRFLFQRMLECAFGKTTLEKDKNMFSRLNHAHRHVTEELKKETGGLTVFNSNSQEAAIKHGRTRPKRPKKDQSKEPNCPYTPGLVVRTKRCESQGPNRVSKAPETCGRKTKSLPPTSRVSVTETNGPGSDVEIAQHTDSAPTRPRSLERPHSPPGGHETQHDKDHEGNTAASSLAFHMPLGQWEVGLDTSLFHFQPWNYVGDDLAESENASWCTSAFPPHFGWGHDQVALAGASSASLWRQELCTIELPLDEEGCNTAVRAWADKLQVDEAEKCIKIMWDHGWVPKRIAFDHVIEACIKIGDVQRCEWWRQQACTASDHGALPLCTSNKVAFLTVPCDVPASGNASGAVLGHSVTYYL